MRERLRHAKRRLGVAIESVTRFGSAQHALIAAAEKGDTALVARMLREGADPNIQNRWGETALHRAARRGHAETAACLLASGCDHTIADNKGRTPLDPDSIGMVTLHAIRQRYQRVRNREAAPPGPQPRRAEQWAADLESRGIVQVSGLIGADELARMQLEFQAFIRNLEDKMARGEGSYRHYDEEEHWWPQDRAYVSNNAFRYSRTLLELCCRDELREAVELYLGKRAFLSRGVAMRYLPEPEKTNDMFGWHHDMEGRRVKAMILLTDVGARDQCMSYVLGSHTLHHPLAMFYANPCPLEYCRKHLGRVETFDTVGVAGDLFLFDSNGAHRGNRRPDARVRDTFFVEYACDTSTVWGGDIPQDLADAMASRGENPLEWMLGAEKKWDRPITRQAPAWIEDLPRIETWL